MSEDNKETTENNETPENKYLEDSFKLFGIFRIPWNEIKDLSEEDREFLVKRADEVEVRAKEQQRIQQAAMQQQMSQQQIPMMPPPQAPVPQGGVLTPEGLQAAPASNLQI